jgi:hypothetical protein
MSLPGFRAEASTHTRAGHYRNTGGGRHTAQGVHPAYLDSGCYVSCYGNCNQECFRLGGAAKALCLQDCGEVSDSCRDACTRPGPPPPPPPPPPQSVCEPTATTPDYVEGEFRIVGQGGRLCSGPYPPDARLRVELREDVRSFPWFDRTLDEWEGTARGFNFDSPAVSYTCSRGEALTVFVETTNQTTGQKVHSPHIPIWCF